MVILLIRARERGIEGRHRRDGDVAQGDGPGVVLARGDARAVRRGRGGEGCEDDAGALREEHAALRDGDEAAEGAVVQNCGVARVGGGGGGRGLAVAAGDVRRPCGLLAVAAAVGDVGAGGAELEAGVRGVAMGAGGILCRDLDFGEWVHGAGERVVG